MNDVIKLLPDSVANQIAAGEVIQRPASVIKELVENAIDAGATEVEIVLKDAGRTLIQVIDNGCGMSDTDARLAFERHSTSKITKADDLFTLRTMGFRGEALASIAAIAMVELRTRRGDQQLGTRLVINGSQCEEQEPVACPVGSNFMIKNIFFNVPARRKFLKSNRVELSNIIHEFEKLALVNNTVAFTMSHDGKVLYKLQGGTFIQRIGALMGHNIDQQLLPIDVDTAIVRITGFIGRVENSRRRNALQYMFANERFMRHPYFHKAVMAAYDQLIPADTQPNYFLRFTVDPQALDVNIHPTKTEIKFEDEVAIWQILNAGVKATLGRFSDVPAIDFDTEDAPKMPAYGTPVTEAPTVAVDTGYNPFNTQRRTERVDPDWESLYRRFASGDVRPSDTASSPPTDGVGGGLLTSTASPTEWPGQGQALQGGVGGGLYLQLKNRYILTPARSGLMVIDQHRAHMLILYSRYMATHKDGTTPLPAQRLLFPVELRLDERRDALLDGILDHMRAIGFAIEPQDANGTWLITATPADVAANRVTDLIETMLERIDDTQNAAATLRTMTLERVAAAIAAGAALPYGRSLSPDEMEHLVSQLLALPAPNYTPTGKLIISIIPFDQITRLFQ
ncbi:MAG: DNA mismatch repair endonuclease MutL [Muribaculaceae bacterium]|nr:DNA mismatch repair endonuclease MutL [Muribaculaceae bacterium]